LSHRRDLMFFILPPKRVEEPSLSLLASCSPGRLGMPAGQVRRSHCSVAEKAKRDAVRCSRGRIRPPAARRFWRKPPVRYVASMSRNHLTKSSNSDRTYQEHRKSADNGSGVGCWGTLAVRT
jgi:hypothetical protein